MTFHVLAKPIGPKCNIACGYCFYLEKEKLYPNKGRGSGWAMPEAVLESFIRQKLESSTTPVESFAWQGGEPTLLGVDYFRRVVALQRRHAKGRKVENALQTNGMLLDATWCDFLKENDFLVGLSIDGPRHLHDHFRVDKQGRPTFDAVMAGLSLLKEYGVTFNTLTVVQRHNGDHGREVYRFLKEAGSGVLQFIPAVEPVAEAQVSDGSVLPEQWGRFLIEVFDDWVRHDVGRTYVQLFDVALQIWSGLGTDLCLFSETCGRALALEHNGDLYACDHFVDPDHKLGNLLRSGLAEMVASEAQSRFGLHKRDGLPRLCRECEVRFLCHGECPKNRFAVTPDGEAGLNYLCAGYKAFFHHSAPHMRFMSDALHRGRAPAEVMAWTRAHDAAALAQARPPGAGRPAKLGRNAPCPCGSGRKHKQCCLRRA